jgi:hypothetical protein
MDPLRTLAGLRNRARQFGDTMLRLAGLDDLSMDLEEARLRQELRRLQAKRGGSPDVETTEAVSGKVADTRGRVAKAREALSDRAASAALALLEVDRRRS